MWPYFSISLTFCCLSAGEAVYGAAECDRNEFSFAGQPSAAKPSGEQLTTEQRARLLDARKKQLIKVLQGNPDAPFPGSVTQRAAEELGLMKGITADDVRILLDGVTKGPASGKNSLRTSRTFGALASTGSVGAKLVTHRLKKADPEDESDLLSILAMMGPSARSAIPVLRAMLRDSKTEESTKTVIRVTLANIEGKLTKQESGMILADLQGDMAGSIYQAMMGIRSDKWVTDEIVAELEKPLAELKKSTGGKRLGPGEGIMYHAILLGQLGPPAKKSAGTLEEFLDVAIKKKDPQALIIALALARIDASRADQNLSKVLRKMNDLVESNARGMMLVLSEGTYLLADSHTNKVLAKLVMDADSGVAESAVLTLASTGLSASNVFPDVMRSFQLSNNVKIRVALAELLPAIADFEQLLTLEEVTRKEPPGEVRDALEESVRSIRLLK